MDGKNLGEQDPEIRKVSGQKGSVHSHPEQWSHPDYGMKARGQKEEAIVATRDETPLGFHLQPTAVATEGQSGYRPYSDGMEDITLG